MDGSALRRRYLKDREAAGLRELRFHDCAPHLRSEAARAASGMRVHDKRFFRLLGGQVVRLLQAASNPMLLTQGELVPRGELEPTPQGARAWELLRELARYEQPAKVAHAAARSEQLISSGKRVLIWSGFILNLTWSAPCPRRPVRR